MGTALILFAIGGYMGYLLYKGLIKKDINHCSDDCHCAIKDMKK